MTTEAAAVVATIEALGDTPPEAADLAGHEHGTVVRRGGRVLLVTAPYDPSGTGRLRLRAVYPTAELRMVTTPPVLVAELPGPAFLPLQDPEAFAAFGRWAGAASPLALLELLVTCQGNAVPIRTGDELTPLLTPTDLAAVGPCEPPVITRTEVGWHAVFASYTEIAPDDAPRCLVVDDWTADFTGGTDFRWSRGRRAGEWRIGRRHA